MVVATRLRLTDFRNYRDLQVDPHPRLTVLVGANAVGKTNIIEAFQVMTSGMSFRRPRWDELIRWGCDATRVTMEAGEGERTWAVSLDVAADGARTFSLNGQVKRRVRDAVSGLPSVTFTPDDLTLVKGPSERRRAAADELGEQVSAAYGSLRRDYAKVVRQRNALLRDGAGAADLAPWDDQLASLGGRLVAHRLRLVARVMDEATRRYAAMARGETLTWSYEDRCGLEGLDPSRIEAGDAADRIAERIRVRSAEERRRSVGLVGPHRDDIVFSVGDRPARAFASQGQQRTAALAWKLAEVSVIEEVMHRRPILLLDDVMSELDAPRRAALAATVAGRTQTVVTTTNLGYFDEDALRDATVMELGGPERKKGRGRGART